MTQATHDDTIVSNDNYSLVRRTNQVGDPDHFIKGWYVYQDNVKIGFVYLPENSATWEWKTVKINNNEIVGGFYDTRGDATDALIRYVASHRG